MNELSDLDALWNAAWPAWMLAGHCWSPSTTVLRIVVGRLDDRDILECGHDIETLALDLPLATYRRGCPDCGHPETIVDRWFPPKGGRVAQHVKDARAVCENCPVKVQCGDYAIDHRIRSGVWGGMTYPMRKRLVDY